MNLQPVNKKTRRSGCLIALLVFGFPCALLYYHANKAYSYHDSAYKHDYTWNNIEVGTIQRVPRGNPLPSGRFGAVIAFRDDQNTFEHVLLDGPKGEIPRIPKFISGKENIVTYSISEGSTTNLDITLWKNFPLRSSTSVDSIR